MCLSSTSDAFATAVPAVGVLIDPEGQQHMPQNNEPWWRRLFATTQIPAYVTIRPDDSRRCPDCYSFYEARDRYCPNCHTAVPEWRFG